MINIKQTLKKTALGAAAVATLGGASFAATSADAHPDDAGVAIGAGILGLAVGAAIASSHHDYDYRYERPYYGYGYGPRYYRYDYGPGYYDHREICRSYWHWSPRWGRYVRVTHCY